jgi:hypothetical protein
VVQLGDHLGFAGLVLGVLGAAVTILWSSKRWIGWTCLVIAVVLISAWAWLALRYKPNDQKIEKPHVQESVPEKPVEKKPADPSGGKKHIEKTSPSETHSGVPETAYGIQHIAPGGTGYQANGPYAKVEVNPLPQLISSIPESRETGDPNRPWVTTFSIHATAALETGDLRVQCSGPALLAGISRINPFGFSSGSNGPDASDPNVVVYQLAPEPLSPGKGVSVSVYSLNRVSILSAKLGSYQIQFPR